MFEISEILKAQACDNLPRIEVSHDNETASTDQAVESVSGSGTAGADAAECGAGDSELGMCPRCKFPVMEWQEFRHIYEGNVFIHRNCLTKDELPCPSN